MGYKQYQQVLNLSAPSKPKSTKCLTSKKATATKTNTIDNENQSQSIKKRTKTGCFTCRRRKKKCDMDKVDGKCQACIRNFLDCCWPEPEIGSISASSSPSSSIPVPHSHTPSSAGHSTPILSPQYVPSSPVSSPLTVEAKSNDITKGAHAYPSPISSPRSEAKKLDVTDINFLVLPPASVKQDSKVTKPRTTNISKPSVKKQQRAVMSQFIVTSFNNDNELRQIRS